MRVCIDVTPLLLRSAGVKTYLYYLVEHLILLAGRECVDLFPLVGPLGPCLHERSVSSPPRTVASLVLLHAANALGGWVLGPVGRRVDVFHASHQLQNPPRNCRITATLYDMTCWLMPEMHSAANVRATRRFAERVMRRADGLTAISESTRNDAVRILGLDPERIAVIYPGVAPAYFEASREQGEAVARRYGIAKPFVLTVGTVEPRKNLGTLIEAWLQLPDELRNAFDLVLVGSAGWGETALLERLRSGLPSVKYLGYVPETDLPALNAAASVFAYVSLYEGFGLPLAQALAAGVPAVTSNVSSLPEVAGPGGILVDPRSPSELRGALARLLASAELRARLGASGAQHAQRFRWENSAACSWRWFGRITGSLAQY